MGHSPRDRYDIVFTDLTSNCNLRCPFCLNDWSAIQGNTCMETETFRKLLTLLPLVRPGGFFGLSCLFEPTLHPEFAGFLRMIPEPERSKVFFTTNLAKPLPDSFFRDLAETGLAFVNISLDSLKPAVFESLRKGARFPVFRDNLERLVRAFGAARNPPSLRYITVLCRENADEVETLLSATARDFLAAEHEFRGFGRCAHQDRAWTESQSFSHRDWEQVRDKLARLPYKSLLRPYEPPPYKSPVYFGLSVTSSGILTPVGLPGNIQMDIRRMDSPAAFFKSFILLHAACMESVPEDGSISFGHERLAAEQSRTRRLRMRLFPKGSRRERLGLLWIQFQNAWLNQGFRAAARKTGVFILGVFHGRPAERPGPP